MAALTLIACAEERIGSPESETSQVAVAETLPTDAPLVIFLGDSLTAGTGIAEEQAFPARTGEILRERGLPIRLVNAGLSGDTTAGGVTRLEWLLSQEPQVMVVELGANDGLRGLSLAETESNLDLIVERCREAGVEVLLAGMKIPPNYGPEYSAGFESIYPRVAARHSVELMPFLLAGVAAEPDLNLADGVHPNPEGHAIVARNLAPYLEAILRQG